MSHVLALDAEARVITALVASSLALCVPSWTIVSAAPVASGKLAAVAASSPNGVWAVGDGFAEQWNGTQWHVYELKGETLDAVVAGRGGVWAAGQAGRDGVVDRWNGLVWKRAGEVAPRGPGTKATRFLYAVAASSPNDVWAVGADASNDYRTDPYTYSVSLHWNGRSWSEPPTLRRINTEFKAVAVASPSDVWLAGDDATGRGLVAHWDGRGWRLFHLAWPGDNGGVYLTSIVQHGSGNVTVYGSAPGGDDQLTFSSSGILFRWNGRTWRRTVLDSYLSYLEYDAAAAIPRHGIWVVANDTDRFSQQAGSQLFTVEHPRGRLNLPQGHVLAALAWDGQALWAVGWVGTGWGDPDNDYSYKDFVPLVMRYGCQ